MGKESIRSDRYQRRQTSSSGFVAAIVVLFIVFDIWLVNLLVGLDPYMLGDRGTFGDMFGASNALFSGLALTGITYAVLLQRAEVRLTKEELHRTKQIFEKQSQSLELQNEETKKQIFENSFFQLLRVLTDLTENLDLTGGPNPTRGKDVLTVFEKRLNRIEGGIHEEGGIANYENVYSRLYNEVQNDLGHYFRTLYTILSFVDNSDVANRKFYTNILRAQLSNSELHLLLYNGVSKHGVVKLKPLLERYEFFDNLPLENVKFQDALPKYEEKAFGHNNEIKMHNLNKLNV